MLLAACSGTSSEHSPEGSARSTDGPDGGAGGAGSGSAPSGRPDAVPDAVLDLMRDLPTYPAEMRTLHRLCERMHVQASECGGFATEERAELETFDSLSDAHTDRDEARRQLEPVMTAVRSRVVPNLVDKLKACREAQRGSTEDRALDALMLACFGTTRADVPVTNGSGSTAYGDPLRLPSLQSLRASTSCTDAATAAGAIL